MPRTIEEVKTERAEILAKQRKILDLCAKEKRELSAEEQRKYDALERDDQGCIEEIEYLQGYDEECRATAARGHVPRPGGPAKPHQGVKQPTKDEEAAIRAALKKQGRRTDTMPTEYRFDPNGTELRDSFNRYLIHGAHGISEGEFRALSADSDVGGGYLVVPKELASEILAGLDNELQFRQLARRFPLPFADSLGVPTLGDDFGDVTFTAELKTGSEDTTMDFQGRDLHPHPCARRIKVSNKLLRVSQLNPEAFVRERMIQVAGQVLENSYLNGNGANQPLGIFTNSAHGIGADRDYSTDNTATQVKADNLIGAVGMLKAQYRRGAVWIAHRDFETQVRKLKDGEGNYLWKAGLDAAGNTLLGFPMVLSEYAPNTFTTGRYVAVLANLRFYWIADALNMQIQRLSELYAETNQTGFIIRHETDGMPVWPEAFVRIKLG